MKIPAMIAVIGILVTLGIAAGPVLANLKSRKARRGLGWSLLAVLVLCAHIITSADDPFFRMVAICCVLLGGMKGLVYAEWSGPEKLTVGRYAIFSLCWFGMDPGAFRERRPGLAWKPDVFMGATLALSGILGAWLVWFMGWRHVFVMFAPLSLGFHFGALRILKGLMRRAGFPVRTLFPNPWQTRGLADFWGRRWNVGYSQMMQRLVGRPLEAMGGPRVGLMGIFLVSGLLHELAITLPVGSGFGLPTVYFVVHGLLTLLEKELRRPMGKIPALLAVILPLGWLFPPVFQSEVIERCLEVFSLLPEHWPW